MTIKPEGKKVLEKPTKISSAEYPAHPHVAVGAIVFEGESVLLIRRGQPPSEGVWAIPGGKVKLGETMQEAAEREIREETGVLIRARDPVFTFDVVQRDESGRVRFHYVIVDLVADYIDGEPRSGDDALEARWVSAAEMKNLNISGPTRQVLKKLFKFGP